MMFFVLFIELFILYLLSRWVMRSLFALLLLVVRSQSVAISLLLVLTYPGTVIHELAHLFTAEILRVPTGKLTLVPESIRGDPSTSLRTSIKSGLSDTQDKPAKSLRAGSVAIAETDPFRRYAIGLAPMFWGMIALSATSYLVPDLSNWTNWMNLIYFYLMFAISNTMFSSPEDLKGFWPFTIVVCVFIAAGYYYGVRFELTGPVLDLVTRILTTLTRSLGIVLLVNITLLVVSRGLSMGVMRLVHRRAR